jgi:hypothetical protein
LTRAPQSHRVARNDCTVRVMTDWGHSSERRY